VIGHPLELTCSASASANFRFPGGGTQQAKVASGTSKGCTFLTDVNVSQFGLKRLFLRESRLSGV
jgi:hypothetical protein